MVGFENGMTRLDPPRKIDKYFVFVVGIDHYQDGIPELKNPVLDANRVLNTLLEIYKLPTPKPIGDLREKYPKLYGNASEPIPIYDDIQITSIYDADATLDVVDEKWRRIFNHIGENDALLVYFAGHGYKDSNEYYIPMADSPVDKWARWFNVSSLYRRFKSYSEDKKCKDYLLILDCCYGGQIALGTGRLTDQDYSRYVLTSCLPYQLANDGPPGKGSPFANALVRYLRSHRWPYLMFDRVEWQRLSAYYIEIARKRSVVNQELLFERLPETDTGPTRFVFEKRNPRLDVTFLKDSIINNLNFTSQKSDLEELYSSENDRLNFIYTQTESSQISAVLVKVILKWFSNSSYVAWEPSACNGIERITIDKYEQDEIWDVLTKQIRTQGEELTHENILEWYFDKLKSDEPAFDGKSHLILWLNFRPESRNVVERIRTFIEEFSKMFLLRLERETEEDRRRMGKMFIILSDERAVPVDHSEELESIDRTTFNFIPTRPVTKVKVPNVKHWIKSFKGDPFEERLNQLKQDNVLGNLAGAVREWKLPEFVNMVCNHCKLSPAEKDDLLTMLYASCDKSLIPNNISDED